MDTFLMILNLIMAILTFIYGIIFIFFPPIKLCFGLTWLFGFVITSILNAVDKAFERKKGVN